jgi:AcrR family transcriptional regulator
MTEPVKRQYKSPRRQEQADETRQRILRAAYGLFVANGYGRTTMTDIAQRAGVAVETVYAVFGNKATVLRQAWFLTFRGDVADVPLYERAEMQAILEEADLTTRIRKHAAFVAANNRRMAALYAAVQGAAASEQAAAAMLDEIRNRYLDVAGNYARAAAATGQLAVDQAECRDVLFATMDGALWHRLVGECGWTDERYANWLADLWISLFVRHPEGRAHQGRADRGQGAPAGTRVRKGSGRSSITPRTPVPRAGR